MRKKSLHQHHVECNIADVTVDCVKVSDEAIYGTYSAQLMHVQKALWSALHVQ